MISIDNPFAAKLLADGHGKRPSFAVPTVDEPATDKQRAFISSLVADRFYGDHKFAARIDEVHLGQGKPLTKEGASKLIELLKECPLRPSAERRSESTQWPNVPAGRYAVETEDGATNELAFYKVDRPEDGRWAGYVFVSHIVGGDEQRMDRRSKDSVLAKIAANPEAASARYGHEIGECGICGRRLTNDESRARGIGPVCATKSGW